VLSVYGFWQAAVPLMRARGGGRIINFHSIDDEAGAWLHADYNLTKAAIQSLTRSAAVEWGRYNILVNAIAPAAAGTVEAWARSSDNPVGGWYGLKKGLRGRFANYVPPVMELLGLAEVEHNPKNNRMRGK